MELSQIILTILALEIGLISTPFMGGWLLRRERYNESRLFFRFGAQVGRVVPTWRASSALNMCASYLYTGDFLNARPYAEKAVIAAEKYRQKRLLAQGKAFLGLVLIRQNETARAEQLLQEAMATPMPPRLRSLVALYTAHIYSNVGRHDEARVLLTELRAAPKMDADTKTLALCHLAILSFYEGHLEAARQQAEEAVGAKVKQPWIHAVALAGLLHYQANLGLFDAARDTEARLMPLILDYPPQIQAALFRAIAEHALKRGDFDRARDYAEKSYPLDTRPNAQAGCLLIQAEVFLARQNTHRARTLCEEALRLDAIDYYKNLARTLLVKIDLPPFVVQEPNTETVQSRQSAGY